MPSNAYSFPSGRFVVGKTAKLRQTQVGEKVPGDIVEHEEDDWVPVVTIVDLEEQYIFVQRNWRFGNEAQIANAIEAGLRPPILAQYNHRLFIEVKSSKENFWWVIRKHDRIYRVHFSIVSPNILETNKRAREAVESLKKLFGHDEVKITLTNESGDLEVPEDPVEDYVDYVAEGEGNWEVVTEGERGGKKTHKSSEAAETVDLPVPDEQEVIDERQLELDTGRPAPTRELSDTRMVAEVYSAIGRSLRR